MNFLHHHSFHKHIISLTAMLSLMLSMVGQAAPTTPVIAQAIVDDKARSSPSDDQNSIIAMLPTIEAVSQEISSEASPRPTDSQSEFVAGNSGSSRLQFVGSDDALRHQRYDQYHVVSGDSIWSISEKFLGDRRRFQEIIVANVDRYPVLDQLPWLVIPGWTLIIPPR